jgi:hypothetical protein
MTDYIRSFHGLYWSILPPLYEALILHRPVVVWEFGLGPFSTPLLVQTVPLVYSFEEDSKVWMERIIPVTESIRPAAHTHVLGISIDQAPEGIRKRWTTPQDDPTSSFFLTRAYGPNEEAVPRPLPMPLDPFTSSLYLPDLLLIDGKDNRRAVHLADAVAAGVRVILWHDAEKERYYGFPSKEKIEGEGYAVQYRYVYGKATGIAVKTD